jgi:hypothetical protein
MKTEIPLNIVTLIKCLGKNDNSYVRAVIRAIPADGRGISGARIKMRAERNLEFVSVFPAEIVYPEMAHGTQKK